MVPSLYIQLLGPLVVRRDAPDGQEIGFRSRQERRLLALLLTRRGQVLPSGTLIDAIWQEAAGDAAAVTLRSAVSALRRALDPDGARRAPDTYIVTARGGYGWSATAPAWIDADALTDPAADPAGALALYRGDLLEDEGDDPWLLAERERLRERCVALLMQRVGEQRAQGDAQQAIANARRGLRIAPLHEPLWQLLIEVQARAGDVAAALQSYERLRQSLDIELGALPSAPLRELHTRILQGRLAHEAREPLPQLAGRANELAQLDTWMEGMRRRRGGVVALVGEAGIGKTRLLEEAARLGRARGCYVLLLRGSEIERELPFAPLTAVLRAALAAAPLGLLRRYPPAALAQIAELVPLLRERLPELPAAAITDIADRRAAQLDALTELGMTTARIAPLLICIDDAQWVDAATLAAIGRLATLASARAMLVVLAYHADDLSEHSALHTLLRSLGRAALIKPMLLGRLDRAGVAAALENLGVVVAPEVEARLMALSGGNPLFLRLLVRLLDETDGDAGQAALLAGGTLPRSLARAEPLRTLVLSRLEHLPQGACELAYTLAVLGRPASLDLIEAFGANALAAAEVLLRRELIREQEDGRLVYDHDLIRLAVIGQLSAPQLRLIQRQIAAATA